MNYYIAIIDGKLGRWQSGIGKDDWGQIVYAFQDFPPTAYKNRETIRRQIAKSIKNRAAHGLNNDTEYGIQRVVLK
jgi:hypothetical protein